LRLLQGVEANARQQGASRIYIDTSSRPQYAATRGFYEATGYAIAAELPDFYRSGDGKTIFSKIFVPGFAGAA
jgi:N-acetylglutamate synthase-like GNAT family acetyltransferase